MIDPGPLQLGLLGRGRRLAIEVVPMSLAGLEGLLRRLQTFQGVLAVNFRRQEGRLILRQPVVQIRQGGLVTLQEARGIRAFTFESG